MSADLLGAKPRSPKDLLAVYDAEHRNNFDGTPAPIVGKKDGPLAARLLKRYEWDQLSTWVRLYFVIPDSFIQRGGYTFGVFSACIGKIIQYDRHVNQRATTKPVAGALELRAAQRRDEANSLTTQDMAEEFYRRHPWAKRTTTPNNTHR